MNYKNKKRLQVINYLFNRLGKRKEGYLKEFIIKLVYLSDKLSLLKYGATITSDKFYAFERGPVSSETLAIMDGGKCGYVDHCDTQAVTTFENTYNSTKTEDTKNVYSISPKSKLPDNFSTLSEADMEIMNKVVKIFGKYKYDDLSDYTHTFKEWQPFKDTDEVREPIEIKDVFEDKVFMGHSMLKDFLSNEIIQAASLYYTEG